VLGFLSACGGGSSDNDSDSLAGKEINSGVITGFGSVFINGIRFHTDSAKITSGDTILNNVNELKVGMVATVISDSSTHVASSVKFDEDIKGPVDASLANFNAPFSVMGQTVIVDSATVIDDSISFPLNADDILEISGMRLANDSLLATFIEDKAPGNVNKYKVIGNARTIDTNAKTFKIGGLTINYGTADVNDLVGGNPNNGQLVEVKDENKAYVAGSGTLIATKIEPFDIFAENGGNNDDIQNIQIESAVTGITTPGVQFQIPNFTVNILPGPSFIFGTADEIGVGTVLKIKAIQSANGELDATRITFKRNSARMEAPVDTGGVDIANNRLTVLGITVQINSGTNMEDDRDGVSPFTINDINDNDYLEIRGFTAANGVFVANRLERDDADDKVEIRSIASNVDTVAQSLDILGISITAGPATVFNDGADSATSFFDALTDGLSIVKVKWDPFVNVGFAPKEMELED
jgi:hypothetical protein